MSSTASADANGQLRAWSSWLSIRVPTMSDSGPPSRSGVTNAPSVSILMSPRPGMLVRATSQASGTPSNVEIAAVENAKIIELMIGWIMPLAVTRRT